MESNNYIYTLNENILKYIYSKCSLTGVISLHQLKEMPDGAYKILYMEKFSTFCKFAYKGKKFIDILSMDANFTWREHYIQMFRFINYLDSIDIDIFTGISGVIESWTILHGLRPVNSSITLSFMGRLIYGKRIPDVLIYEKDLIDAMVLLLLYTSLYECQNKKESYILTNYMYALWKHSEIYFEYVVVSIKILGCVTQEKCTFAFYQLEPNAKLNFYNYDLNYIKSNNEKLVEEKYGSRGLYIKYIFRKYPHHIK